MIIGGAAGAALGGPIGGLLGAAAGIAVERGFIAPARAEPDGKDRGRGVAFTVAVIALSAKMAKVDGVVTRDEIAAFRARVHIPRARWRRSAASGIWRARRRTASNPTPARWPACSARARRFLNSFGPAVPHRRSDASISEPEIEYLARVTDIFGFSEDDFQRLLALHAAEARNRGTFSASTPTFPMTSCAATGRRWCATTTPTG